jgi:dolichol-phosphate mannosyltransferase
MTPKLAIVIPTFNESGNVQTLLERISLTLSKIEWEVVFVDDDSPDGTSQLIRHMADSNSRVRLIQRIGRRGLASACVEGMLSTSAPYIAVMDADLQHDESILPKMLETLESRPLDVVVASRHAGGSMGDFSRSRVWLSNLGKKLATFVCHAEITDPMSGFFMIRASYLYEVMHRLSQSGFKILVDLLASSRRPVRAAEVPYTFRSRLSGESKLDSSVLTSYLYLLVDQLVGRWIPVSFVLFCLVGATGVLLHLALLATGLRMGLAFEPAQVIGTFVAMTYNYIVNNNVTFVQRKRKGFAWLTGLLAWYAACSVGIVFNVRIADLLHDHGLGWLIAGTGGLAIAALWNYGLTSVMVWRGRVRAADERSKQNLAWVEQQSQ